MANVWKLCQITFERKMWYVGITTTTHGQLIDRYDDESDQQAEHGQQYLCENPRMPVEEIFIQYRIVVGQRFSQSRQTSRWNLFECRFVSLVSNATNIECNAILCVRHVAALSLHTYTYTQTVYTLTSTIYSNTSIHTVTSLAWLTSKRNYDRDAFRSDWQ